MRREIAAAFERDGMSVPEQTQTWMRNMREMYMLMLASTRTAK